MFEFNSSVKYLNLNRWMGENLREINQFNISNSMEILFERNNMQQFFIYAKKFYILFIFYFII